MNRVSDAMRRAGQDLQDVDLSIKERRSHRARRRPSRLTATRIFLESEVVPMRSLLAGSRYIPCGSRASTRTVRSG